MVYERFLDLLDAVEDHDENNDTACEEKLALYTGAMPRVLALHDESHGPLKWSTHLSVELQRAVDNFNSDKLRELNFSVTVADPSLDDCPLVACSIGFTHLTGYTINEIVGRNCRFMLNGVPAKYVDEEVRMQCRSFCQTAQQGEDYNGCQEVLPTGLSKCWFALPEGELVCIQVNAHKSGELFRNMFYLKQVELDDAPYILALQAGIPECGEMPAVDVLQSKFRDTWQHLVSSMATIEDTLASQFWYHTAMRRQCNLKPSDHLLKNPVLR